MEALFRKIASKAKSTNECNIVHKVFDESPLVLRKITVSMRYNL